jgi:membrane protease YdiL (CAAX protease family)
VAAVALVVVGSGALVLDTASTALLQRLLAGRHVWLLDLHLPELVIALVLYLATGPAGTWRLPSRYDVSRRFSVGTPLVWLGVGIGSTALVMAVRGPGAWSKGVGLCVTHLLGQELLFRGAIYQLAERVWPARRDEPDGIAFWAVLASALLWGLAQLQYFGFAFSGPLAWQVVRALVFGLLMACARPYFRSLWPGAAFQAINNGLFVLRG